MTDILINGLPRRDLDCRDRGLQYGDGFFTTIRVIQGKPQLWSYHMARLEETSRRLCLPIPEAAKLLAETRQVSRGQGECAVRLTFTRSVGGQGYLPPQKASATRIVRRSPVPVHYEQWRSQGITLSLSEQRLAIQPMLAGLKTLNRLEQVLLKIEQQRTQADDLLVLNTNEHVCETTVANIFWRQGEQWYTPSMKKSGVAGVVRQHLLEHNPLNVDDFPLSSLMHSDEAFICNSLMGLVPVQSISEHKFPVVRPYTEQLDTDLSEVAKPA